MSQVLSNNRAITALSFAAAAATVLAGILHLLMVPRSISQEAGEGVLFLVGGILQVFWAVPVLKGWGRAWQIVGIGGTVVFMILWFATHTHSLFGPSGAHVQHGLAGINSSNGGHHAGLERDDDFPRGEARRGLAGIPSIEYIQMAFVGLYAALGVMTPGKSSGGKKDIVSDH